MSTISDKVLNWNTQSYVYFLLQKKDYNGYAKQLVEQYLIKQNKALQCMFGSITNNAVKEELALPIMLSSVFDKTVKRLNGDFDLLDYLLDTAQECLIESVDTDLALYTIGRAMRSFPSFIRELDLLEKLEELEPLIDFKHSVDIDLKEHADTVFDYNWKRYYGWSYVCTDNGCSRLLKKLRNRHGDIPKGYHLLMPFDLSKNNTNVKGWLFYSKDYVQSIINELKQQKHIITHGQINSPYVDFELFKTPAIYLNKEI